MRDMSDTEIQKPARERSKAYPGAPLEDCVRYTSQIKKELGRGSHDRESLAKAMGFGSVSGAVSPKIAALVHFGFLNRTAAGYELSDYSKSITDPIDERERTQAIRVAFSRPYLYQEILSKFEADGKIPSQLATHLHRFHGITDAASSSAAEIFVSSGRFAGVLDEDNNILRDTVVQKTEETMTAIDPQVPAIRASAAQPPVVPAPSAQHAPASGLLNQQRFEFAITGGRTVVLTVPSDLNQKDIKVIRKQIELLELQVNLGDEAD